MGDLYSPGQSVRRRPLCKVAELRRAVSHHGLRTTDLPRSLRDIEDCLLAQSAKLYHGGFRQQIERSTLADAKESRARSRGIYVMDRGYLDFERRHAFHQANAFFVTRAKPRMCALSGRKFWWIPYGTIPIQ